MTALFLAMLMTLTAFVGVSVSAEDQYDEVSNPKGYACKIVSADGTQTTYYKYFSPMDKVGTQSAYDYAKANIAGVTNITTFNPYAAVQNVQNGETIVFLKDITLTTLSNIDFGTGGKLNGYNTNVNAKGGYIISDGGKSFTVDGNNKAYNSLGGFIASKASLTVKNLTINMIGTESVGHARNGHTLTFDHCSITIGGVRAVGTNNAYFEFNSKTGTLDLRDTSISVDPSITPVVPLFMSKTDNNVLKLHNVNVTYPLTAIKAVNPGLSVTLSGNTSLTTSVKAIELQYGGTVVMNNNASVECVSTGSSASGNAGIHAYGAEQSFRLVMNDSSAIRSVSGGKNAGVSTTCSSNTIILNENASISAYQSIRVDTAPATIYLNDSADITASWANPTEMTGTPSPIYVNAENANCNVYVNANATIGNGSTNNRVPFTYDTGISFVEGSEGLRFDSRIQADTTALEFGTLITKYETALGLEDLTHAALDAAGAKYLDIKATAENCLTLKIKESGGNDFYLFGATITGITEKNYNTQYTARSYAKYQLGSTASYIWFYSSYSTIDQAYAVNTANNNSSLAYTAYEAVNNVVETADPPSDPDRDVYGNGYYIYNVAEDGQKPLYSRYTKAQYDALKVYAKAYQDYVEERFNSNENLNAYKETSKDGSVNVHEVVIGEAGDGKTATTVVQISDLHLRANGEMDGPGTAFRATANAGASIAWAITNGDQIVITGDLFNKYSEADANLFESTVWNQDEDGKIMVTLGNHDFMNTTDGAELAGKDWVKLYQSKVLNNVMIITLDNASNGDGCAFTDEQYDLLAADLATARANDYDVLLFYHIPLPTGLTADAVVKRLDDNGDENNTFINLYSPSHSDYSAWRTDYATQNVYKLITDNADIIDAAFCGHKHVNLYSEIQGKNGEIIPQYTLISNAYAIGGSLTKITVYN